MEQARGATLASSLALASTPALTLASTPALTLASTLSPPPSHLHLTGQRAAPRGRRQVAQARHRGRRAGAQGARSVCGGACAARDLRRQPEPDGAAPLLPRGRRLRDVRHLGAPTYLSILGLYLPLLPSYHLPIPGAPPPRPTASPCSKHWRNARRLQPAPRAAPPQPPALQPSARQPSARSPSARQPSALSPQPPLPHTPGAAPPWSCPTAAYSTSSGTSMTAAPHGAHPTTLPPLTPTLTLALAQTF